MTHRRFQPSYGAYGLSSDNVSSIIGAGADIASTLITTVGGLEQTRIIRAGAEEQAAAQKAAADKAARDDRRARRPAAPPAPAGIATGTLVFGAAAAVVAGVLLTLYIRRKK